MLLALIGLFFVQGVMVTEASHRDWGRADTSSLHDDPVKSFSIPVLFGVELTDMVPDFGDARGGGTREHEGQDMRAPQGTPIVSPTEAIVLRTGTGASAGKYVYTANPGGEVFRYMHLDDIADIERGDELAVGDFIGTVGDTGNAGPGVYHLHFEVRDEDNDPTDPYERLAGSFSIADKMDFLEAIFRDIRNDEEYAEFLVTEFEADFMTALAADVDLPNDIEDALEDTDMVKRQKLLEQLNELIDAIPSVLVRDLALGDSGTEVSLLQTYLLFRSTGNARDRLAAAGATGYYGAITSAAVTAWQEENGLTTTGLWDLPSRQELAK